MSLWRARGQQDHSALGCQGSAFLYLKGKVISPSAASFAGLWSASHLTEQSWELTCSSIHGYKEKQLDNYLIKETISKTLKLTELCHLFVHMNILKTGFYLLLSVQVLLIHL